VHRAGARARPGAGRARGPRHLPLARGRRGGSSNYGLDRPRVHRL